MVRVRTLAPLTHPTTDEHFGEGVEVDVADDVAAEWRAAGKVSLIEDEERNIAAATHYSDVTGRDDVATPQPRPSGGPQEDDEEPPKRGGKK